MNVPLATIFIQTINAMAVLVPLMVVQHVVQDQIVLPVCQATTFLQIHVLSVIQL